MKFGELIEYNVRKNFLQKSYRKLGRKTCYRPYFVIKKALYDIKASGLKLRFNIFRQPSTWPTIKTIYKTLETIDLEI